MPQVTYRANVWDQIRSKLPEEFDKLDGRITREVDDSPNWREEITLALTDAEAAEVRAIVEDEDLNTE